MHPWDVDDNLQSQKAEYLIKPLNPYMDEDNHGASASNTTAGLIATKLNLFRTSLCSTRTMFLGLLDRGSQDNNMRKLHGPSRKPTMGMEQNRAPFQQEFRTQFGSGKRWDGVVLKWLVLRRD
ncbi:hypothetical protein FEM48_Zijuj01G0322300 [Ziziphus jujuba var. spinosa]|uniref:Uncharacterized protein n=1 Tax=Ziziphus jujuba var. spinosa TaxID=714518 RepID=A0A978W6H1_ZIZJJ|nr:hypothetical protein FEM48_Zijuj01G0322300 [Ziziphus jujuba var. spinosa]